MIDSTCFEKSQVDIADEVCVRYRSQLEANNILNAHFTSLQKTDPGLYSHLNVVSFFSVLIANELGWTSNRIRESLVIGSYLHDIGKLHLNPDIMNLSKSDMSSEQLIEYKKHPGIGVQILRGSGEINEPIIQIVYQHHEQNDLLGFPNRLNGAKIYPLAKIVAVSNAFSHHLKLTSQPPVKAIHSFFDDPSIVFKYDAEVLRPLLKCFIGKKDKTS